MIKVECPSCTAPYELDERRLPQNGLKMRCPKCGASFRVHPSGETGPADAAPAAPAQRPKKTMVGVAPPAPPGTAPPKHIPGIGMGAPPAPPKPQQQYRPSPPGGGSAPDPSEVDLPAPKPPAKRPLAPPFPGGDLDVDLPAPKAAAKPPFPGGDLDVDLPAPKRPAKRPLAPPFPSGDLDVDLPAPKAAAKPPIAPPFPGGDPDVSLPAPKAAQALRSKDGGPDLDRAAPKPPLRPTPPEESFADLDLDLPAVKGDAAPEPGGGGIDIDLPAPKRSSSRTPFDDLEVDLPAPKAPSPPPGDAFLGADEPTVIGQRPDLLAASLDDLDLPAPKRDADLPAPKRGAAGPFDDLDLPMPKANVDLPAPKGDLGGLDLPMPKGQADLPAPKGGGPDFGDLDLPVPKGGADLPVAKTGGLDDLDLPVPKGGADLPVPKTDFGDLDLPPPAASAPPRFDDLELPEPPGGGHAHPGSGSGPYDGHVTADGRAGAGGVGFGEIDFGDEQDDMEFADIPEERPSAPGARAAAAAPAGPIGVAAERPGVGRIERPLEPGEIRKPRRKGRALVYVVGFLVVVVLAGVGVGLFTPHGYFGVYVLEQLLPEAGDDATVNRVLEDAEQVAATDTYSDARASITKLGQARRATGLNRRLLARSLLHESLYQVRFGEDTHSESRGAAILQRIDSRGGEAPGIALGRAAWALARGDAQQARGQLGAARAEAPRDPFVDLVAGEVALALDEPEQAAEAFRQAAEKGGSARAQWGLARALMRLDDPAAAAAAVDATLEASPRHAEALAARGGIAFERGDVDLAMQLARQAAGAAPVDGETIRPSAPAKARAFTLLGRIHEARGNRSRAREAYDRALEADPFAVAALLGAGHVLLADGRHRDALARFQAVIDSGETELPGTELARPLQVEAKLGAARAMVHVERAQEAKATLQELLAQRSEDPEVVLWLGKAEQALGAGDAAEQHYREVVRLAPDRFDGYLALAQLFFRSERADDAVAVLTEAQNQVDDTAEVRRLLGESELARNNLDAAIGEFRRALELDANDTAARFGLGVAQRRAGNLTEASETFAQVAAEDEGWPGLALERGMVFEAQGQSDRAVRMYQQAVEERPEETDLLLRLGAAYVSARQIDDAEATLERVIAERPNSAEAEHFMGRVSMAREDLEDAMTHFSRAVSLDGNRGEFWLYVGWTALEMGNLGRALEAISKALELDPSLGDAYWIRGRIRVRTGAVQDARQDLERALELKPSRYEAHAALGEAYDQLRRLSDAIRSYETALARDESRGEWWYRLGRLRMDAGQAREAKQALARATTLGDAMDPRPSWVPDSHRLHGDAARLTGERQEAVAHYRRYLEIAPRTAIDREEVEEHLRRLGGG